MRREDEPSSATADYDARLLIESARDLIEVIRVMGQGLDQKLREAADVDLVISVLSKKKQKVETLKEIAREIKVRLRVGGDGRAGIAVSEATRVEFADLMENLRQLVEEEQQLEELVCGQGLSISRRTR
jgi:hypothetical protein